MRSDWKHFEAETSQIVDEEVIAVVPEIRHHAGKPFVWRFVSATRDASVKMYVLVKLSEVELLKLRVSSRGPQAGLPAAAQASSAAVPANSAKFSALLEDKYWAASWAQVHHDAVAAAAVDQQQAESAQRKSDVAPPRKSPSRWRREAKERAAARESAQAHARRQTSVVWGSQGEDPSAEKSERRVRVRPPRSPSDRPPSPPPKEELRDSTAVTSGTWVPADVERWREDAVATFLGQRTRAEEASSAKKRVGLRVTKSAQYDSKVTGWGQIRFGRRQGSTSPIDEAATSELHDPTSPPLMVPLEKSKTEPTPTRLMTPRDERTLSAAI